MKIFLVMTARTVGGAEIYVERLVSTLKNSCAFTIAMSDHRDMTDFAEQLREHAEVVTFTFDRTRQLPAAAHRLRQLAARCDIVHLNSNHPGSRLGILMGYVLPHSGRPVVCVEQGASPISAIEVPRSIAWSLPTLFRWSRRSVARIVAVSEENQRTLVNLYHLPEEKITVVHNGADLTPFADPVPGTLRQELGLTQDQPLIIVLGRLSPNKGQQHLVQAAPAILDRFPGAHFVLAGNPDDRAFLDKSIRSAGLETHFSLIGFRADVANLLRSSDLFVLPSLAEGFSLAIVEALAAGLPVIATRVGGAAEIIEEGRNGFLVPPANPEALAQAVCRVLGLDPADKEAMRQAARASSASFSIAATAQRMLAIYTDVAG